MKFRIKEVRNVGFFPQCKPSFFSLWKRIGYFNSGYKLYSDLLEGYPHPTIEEARLMIEKFKEWKYDQETTVSYYDL